MATMGLLSTYTIQHGNSLKTNKISSQSLNNNNAASNNNNNNNNKNIINKGATNLDNLENNEQQKREIVIMRKKSKLLPLTESNNGNIVLVTNAQKPVKRTKMADGIAVVKTKSTPLPVAVAKRNARERNRVKQVNNGFAALRQHIPEEVAEAFEAAGNGRGAAKKLSKVETLRMAVEYIRSLERLLSIETDSNTSSISFTTACDSSSLISNSPPLSECDGQNYSNSSMLDDDQDLLSYSLPDITTINGSQYIRIPGTNTYQLITTNSLLENEENIQPINCEPITIVPSQYQDILVDTNLGYHVNNPLHIMTPASVSPSGYSGQSLSPAGIEIKQEVNCYSLPITSRSPSLPSNSSEEGPIFLTQSYDGTLTLKTEIKEENIILDSHMSEESMMEAMDWWDQQQRKHQENT